MDRSIEHLFVFEGNGVIKDFPGNYSEYRQWLIEHPELSETNNTHAETPASKDTRKQRDYSNKLSYKEKKELEALTAEIAELEAEKSEIEKMFNGEAEINDGNSFDSLSKRFAIIKDLLDEKELRWLELSEKSE